ncbi:PaaI family thioesterase [Rhodococcus kronopolitis]|uniref:PaaI family thioesterase n=1 Tax=Rhodococcus kronopolitis TaxID=1460226 RepID=A0ABV9FV59_9NOCA
MTDASEVPDFAPAVNGAVEAAIPVVHGMGVRAVEARRGYASSMVPVAGNGNHFGVMYAGVLFTVAEMLGGAIAVASFDGAAFYPLVKDLRIKFTRPATTDVRAEATLDEDTIVRVTREAAEVGKSDFALDATVTDADGVVVAVTTGLYQLRAHRK